MGSRSFIRRISRLGILMVLLGLSIQAIWAAVAEGLVMESASFACSSVTFSFRNDLNPLSWDFAQVRVINTDAGATIYDSWSSVGPYGDDSPYTASFASQPTGSNLRLEVQVGEQIDSATGSCGSGSGSASPLTAGGGPQCRDKRINQYNCEPVAIYPVKTDAGYDLVVYRITAASQGVFQFSVSAAELAALPDHPETPRLVAAAADNFTKLYWLPSNEYLIIAGPDFEGKMFEFIFSKFPGEEPRLRTYLAG
ncbi:MAG TPA: hypothetical protein VHO69_15810 [Phototrophicaceae bacterium]|nr:hypothetical protein [Phototrophicaceae bacterium]